MFKYLILVKIIHKNHTKDIYEIRVCEKYKYDIVLWILSNSILDSFGILYRHSNIMANH